VTLDGSAGVSTIRVSGWDQEARQPQRVINQNPAVGLPGR
jgi:hypothetical protein